MAVCSMLQHSAVVDCKRPQSLPFPAPTPLLCAVSDQWVRLLPSFIAGPDHATSFAQFHVSKYDAAEAREVFVFGF